jgi:Tfp pilus assembly protein PilN
MKRVRIDFAPPSARRACHGVTALSLFVLMIAVCLSVAVAVHIQNLQQRIDAERAALYRLQATLQARADKPAPASITISPAQAVAVNVAIAQLNLPWREVLDAIESATPKTIALVTLEPDARAARVKGTAEAKSSDDMIAYIEQLKKQEFFTEVALTRHEINEQDSNKPLRFQFEAHWLEVAK